MTRRCARRARAARPALSNFGIAIGWSAGADPSAALRPAELVRHFVELAPQLLDRGVVHAARIFALERRLLGRLLAQIGDRQAPSEHLVAADIELGLATVGEVVADRLEIADQVVERGVLADVDEILDASRH